MARSKIIGMYVHQHWAYNHPYAARTWSLDEWRSYMAGLERLGYNTILVWPVLETMPDPLTPGDQANLDRIARVIDMAHDLGMRLYIVLCPNVAALNEEAAKYTFEERPFFHTDRRVDPGDPEAMAQLIAWRTKLLTPLAQADGLFIIDSDPGGYPGSTNQEFVDLLVAHRNLLDTLRPGIELICWMHAGWEAYCAFYETGEARTATRDELHDTLRRLQAAAPEPWGIASGCGPDIGDALGLSDRVLTFTYAAIEGEPTFPFTNFGGARAFDAAHNGGLRGAMGNAQTHCLQLPNTLAFACGARGEAVSEAGYIDFAEQVLPGYGAPIVEAWSALVSGDAERMRHAIDRLQGLDASSLIPGPLGGLLLGGPERFVDDLLMQLRAKACLLEFRREALATRRKDAAIRSAFGAFVQAIGTWAGQHGYKNHWSWPAMEEALRALDAPAINAVLDTRGYRGQGATPFEQVQDGFRMTETYVPRLIEAMKQAFAQMP